MIMTASLISWRSEGLRVKDDPGKCHGELDVLTPLQYGDIRMAKFWYFGQYLFIIPMKAYL